MLRRSEKIVFKDDNAFPDTAAPEPQPAPPPPQPAAEEERVIIERRSSADRRSHNPNVAPIVERRQGDRRKGERHGVEALRQEALRSVMSRVEDRNFSGIKSHVPLRPNGRAMRRSALLLVAILAGGAAAVLAMQRTPAPAPAPVVPETEIVREARTQILVAREAIAVGQRLTADSVAWEEWPEGAVRPEYVAIDNSPQAIAEMTGAVARFEFFPGEPIRQQKLALAGEGGYLSAVLEGSKRGVSVAVTPDAASGGFIVPNDRVDVMLTRSGDVGQISETVLSNVRVLAINAELGPSSSAAETDVAAQGFSAPAIATLALDTAEAEVIMSAVNMGRLTLALRSMVDPAQETALPPANQMIRMTSPFWKQ